MKKLYNIQALRSVAVLLVVIFHLAAIENIYGHGSNLLPRFTDVGASGVDIFFVISGFIMATIIRDQFQNFNNALNFIIHRITRIYPLYWFYAVIFLASLLLSDMLQGNMDWEHQYNYFRNFLLLPNAGPSILVVSWTLVYEMYFYCVITALLFFSERLFVKLILLWLVIVCVAHYFINPTNAEFAITTSPMTLEFIAGCLIARFTYSFSNRYNYLFLGIGFVSLFAAFYCFQYLEPIIAHEMGTHSIRLLLFGIPSILIVSALVGLETDQIILPKFMIKLGDASYSIYLSHMIVFVTIGKIWQRLPYNGPIFHAVMCTFMLTIVITFGLISYSFIEKPMINFFRNLIEHRAASPALKAGH